MAITNGSYRQLNAVPRDESLWRRIHKTQCIPNSDGTYRVSSAAFIDSKKRDISVDLASKTTPEKSIRNSAALAAFLTEVPINLGYEVVEYPMDDNDAHALIRTYGKTMRKAHAKQIAAKCEWVVEPRL